MRRVAIPLLFLSGLAACSAAAAKEYDSSDPVHCMTVFGVASSGVKTGPIADELNARILFLVYANGGRSWIAEVGPKTLQIGAGWEKSPNEGQIITLLNDCKKRQDSDPEFRAALPGLLSQGRAISSGR